MIKKTHIKLVFKKLHLLSFFEASKFNIEKIKNRNINMLFKKNNPEIVLPPDFFMYETFGLNYYKFHTDGIEAAKWLIEKFEKHMTFQNTAILDWGCGPGRILSHLPNILDKSNSIYGSDYNTKYIKWCNDNIKNVTVKNNSLVPPLKFEKDFFNAIYSISIFTHLSEKMHYKWMEELSRVSKKNAILFITTHGKPFEFKLTEKEKKKFQSGKLIEHSYKVEGNRLYASYQPVSFFKKLSETNGFRVLEHDERTGEGNKPQQDIWILQKK